MSAGRPTKLNAELRAAIVADIEAGNSLECAAEVNGIDHDTAYDWLTKGREGSPEHREFYLAVTRARGVAEQSAVAALEAAWSGKVEHDDKGRPLADWRAAESWLKRARFRTWGDRQQVEQKHQLVDVSDPSKTEALRRALESDDDE